MESATQKNADYNISLSSFPLLEIKRCNFRNLYSPLKLNPNNQAGLTALGSNVHSHRWTLLWWWVAFLFWKPVSVYPNLILKRFQSISVPYPNLFLTIKPQDVFYSTLSKHHPTFRSVSKEALKESTKPLPSPASRASRSEGSGLSTLWCHRNCTLLTNKESKQQVVPWQSSGRFSSTGN